MTPVSPKQLGVDERSGPAEIFPVVVLYVCPTPGCGNYYGSSNEGYLEKQEVLAPSHAKDAHEKRGTRATCPACKAERVRRYARLIPQSEVIDAQTEVVRSRVTRLDAVIPSNYN